MHITLKVQHFNFHVFYKKCGLQRDLLSCSSRLTLQKRSIFFSHISVFLQNLQIFWHWASCMQPHPYQNPHWYPLTNTKNNWCKVKMISLYIYCWWVEDVSFQSSLVGPCIHTRVLRGLKLFVRTRPTGFWETLSGSARPADQPNPHPHRTFSVLNPQRPANCWKLTARASFSCNKIVRSMH